MRSLVATERLQKLIAQAGVASRRRAEELICEGRVSVNGLVAHLGMAADAQLDHIEVDGRTLNFKFQHRYYKLYKPRGYVSTMADPQGRHDLRSLVAGLPHRVLAVGRLDMDSEGLLLLTDDGRLANHLMHPRYEVAKTYRVHVVGHPSAAALQQLRHGILLSDGMTAPAEVTVEEMDGKGAWLQVRLHEGRNRQIRRMLAAVGLQSERLIRIQEGTVTLGNLRPGEIRPLASAEVAGLLRATGLDESTGKD